MTRREFPDDFMWGAATAGHQIEGNNTNASLWPIEWSGRSIFKEPSGDACDSYHRYPEDIALLADAGLGVYRFSVEWSRIEPEPGFYSRAALDHYRRMCEACLTRGVRPFITLNHFTVPRWFTKQGGFGSERGTESFANYARVVADHIGDLITHVATFNEPNLAELLIATEVMTEETAVAASSFAGPQLALGADLINLVAAHEAARSVWRERGVAVGWTLAMPSFHAVDGAEDTVAERRRRAFDQFLDISASDDYVGVQAYTRERFGPSGRIGPPPEAALMETAWEVYPPAIAESVRYAAAHTNVPTIVTENGMATPDDTLRSDYTLRALASLADVVDDGIQLDGYIHWTLLDNWEWGEGFAMHFGLIEVDRTTFERHPKPTLALLGEIARTNSIPEAS